MFLGFNMINDNIINIYLQKIFFAFFLHTSVKSFVKIFFLLSTFLKKNSITVGKKWSVIGDRDLIADHFFGNLPIAIGIWSAITFQPSNRDLIVDP